MLAITNHSGSNDSDSQIPESTTGQLNVPIGNLPKSFGLSGSTLSS
jgi:hypothetical protein